MICEYLGSLFQLSEEQKAAVIKDAIKRAQDSIGAVWASEDVSDELATAGITPARRDLSAGSFAREVKAGRIEKIAGANNIALFVYSTKGAVTLERVGEPEKIPGRYDPALVIGIKDDNESSRHLLRMVQAFLNDSMREMQVLDFTQDLEMVDVAAVDASDPSSEIESFVERFGLGGVCWINDLPLTLRNGYEVIHMIPPTHLLPEPKEIIARPWGAMPIKAGPRWVDIDGERFNLQIKFSGVKTPAWETLIGFVTLCAFGEWISEGRNADASRHDNVSSGPYSIGFEEYRRTAIATYVNMWPPALSARGVLDTMKSLPAEVFGIEQAARIRIGVKDGKPVPLICTIDDVFEEIDDPSDEIKEFLIHLAVAQEGG